MATRIGTQELWSVSTKIGAGAGATNLVAARANRKLVCTLCRIHVIATAAQSADITIGAAVVASLGVSEPVGSETYLGDMARGVVGDVSAALAYTPSAAGYALLVTAEGYYE